MLWKQIQIFQDLAPRYHKLDFLISKLDIGNLLPHSVAPVGSCDDALHVQSQIV